MTTSTDRQTFRPLVAEIAAKARASCPNPSMADRIAVKLVLTTMSSFTTMARSRSGECQRSAENLYAGGPCQ